MKKLLLFLLLFSSCTSGPGAVTPVIGNLSWPCLGTISQEFYGDNETSSVLSPGNYYDEQNNLKFHALGRFHRAIDIAGAEKVAIFAAADGVVHLYAWDGKSKDYGNHIVIDHGKDLFTLYAHLLSFRVSEGQQVKQNELIGEMGSTGNSTGSHLHFEIRHDPDPVKPTLAHFIPGKKGDQVLFGHTIPFKY